MEYLAVVRLRAIADAAQAQAQGNNPSTDASPGAAPTLPTKSKGVKGPILLCVHLVYHEHITVKQYTGSSAPLEQERPLSDNRSQRPWEDRSSAYH
jgi:hypothetical protein